MITNRLALGLFFSFIVQHVLLSNELKIKRASEVIVPIFSHSQAEPVATVKIQKVSREHKRKAFYKVGLMPYLALNSVEIDVNRAESLQFVFNQLGGRLPTLTKDISFEINGLTLTVKDQPALVLKAGKVRVEGRTKWALADIHIRKEQEITASSGVLIFEEGSEVKLILEIAPGQFAAFKLHSQITTH